MKKINYIVLGNTGFIGKNLENYLLRKKKIVKGFASKKINLLIKAKALKLSKFINSKTIIFFLSFNKNQKNATAEDLQKNLLLTKNFLEVLNKNKPKSVLFFSSQSIYGENTKGFLKEFQANLPILGIVFQVYEIHKGSTKEILYILENFSKKKNILRFLQEFLMKSLQIFSV